jgi:hypothetical protein
VEGPGAAKASFQELVVGFDDSERGRNALRLGARLARTTGGRLVVAARVSGAVGSWGGLESSTGLRSPVLVTPRSAA